MRTRTLARTVTVMAATALALVGVAISSAAGASASLVAPRSACDGQGDAGSRGAREDALACLINFARERVGVGDLKRDGQLERAAASKSGDVMQCGFSHSACGRPPDLYPVRYGYTSDTSGWKWGENLAWGKRKKSTPRRILRAWLRSPEHRATMLAGAFEHLGIGVKRGRFSGHRSASIWVLEVGCRGC